MKNIRESKLESRANVIKYIYPFQLLNEEFNADLAFESGDYSAMEIKMIEAISKNYEKLIKLIRTFTKSSWAWERIAPLERAILIFGAFELSFNDTALVINELVIIAQGYIPGDSYKFINSVLDKIGAYYVKLKKN